LARALNLAKRQRDPVQRLTDLGWATSKESPRRAVAHFRGALKRDPTAQSARFGLLTSLRRPFKADDPEILELAEQLEGAASAVVSGWGLAAASEWLALRELEPELASAEWFDPAYHDAQRLRAQWRVASDDPVLHAEAAEIASDFLRNSVLSEDMIVGAQAFALVNRRESALQLLDALSNRRLIPRISQAAVELINSLPPEGDEARSEAIRDRLVRGSKPAKASVDGG
jgi:hypothetical protein